MSVDETISPSQRLDRSAADERLAQVLDAYLAGLEQGRAADPSQLIAQHPEIADRLRVCLDALRFVKRAANTLTDADAPEQRDRPVADLGDYRILREIGRGGMGIVYEAEQVSLGRRVALKVLPFAAVLDAKQLQRFKNEAQAAAHLTHQNIVPVYSVGCERGVHYYAMQFIEGSTLADVIHELQECSVARPRPTSGSGAPRSVAPPWATSGADDAPDSAAAQLPDEPLGTGSSAALDALAPDRSTKSPAFFRSVANLAVQAAQALEHAHEFGVVHRDIKPSNLLLDERGNLWITDFGLARLESDASLTLTGDVLGTLRYMSPEQAAGKNLLLDHRTDIYSLGVTLYELLTLKPAIDGRDRQELLRKIADEDPRPPRRLNAAIPADLETILLKATAKEPHRRYTSAKALTEDLQRFLLDKPIRAKRPTLAERAAKWSRRHRHLVASAVVVLALAVVGLSAGTFLIWQEQARTEQAYRAEREQRELAEKRQKETEQVSEFLSEMLSGIDVEAMGRGIKKHLREQVRAALERQYVGEFPDRRQRTPEEIEAELAAFDQRADAAQAVDVARRVMDEFVLARAADALEEQFADQPLVQADLHSAIGATYKALGLYSAAEPHLNAALEIYRREMGDDHPGTLSSINGMGLLYHSLGKLSEAESYYREALEGRRRVLGDEHLDTVISIDNVGALLSSMGRFDEAQSYEREALEGFRRVLGDDHPDTLTSINNMGVLLKAQGKLDEAEPYYREALEGLRRVLGDEHRDTLVAVNNMAYLQWDLGRLTDAESLFADGTRVAQARLGDHPQTATFEHHHAAVLGELGRLDEAIGLAQASVDRYRAHPDWPPGEAAHARRVLAATLRAAGRAPEALAVSRESVLVLRERPGTTPAGLASALVRFASEAITAGDATSLERAEQALRECLEIRRTVLPDGHPQVWLRYNAISMLGEVLVGQAAHPSAAIGARIEKLREAEPMLLLAWENLKDDPNVPPPSATGGISRTRSALERIVRLYEVWNTVVPDTGKAEQAAKWRTELEKLDGS